MPAGLAQRRAPPIPDRSAILARYREVREATEALAAPLLAEDQVVQSMPDTSPTKWHRAHTTWFFETFILEQFAVGWQPVRPEYRVLFNSYYEAVGPRHARPERGMLSRPSCAEVAAYRSAIDRAFVDWAGVADDGTWAAAEPLIILGLHHEQQHQELLLTDIKHILFQNPTAPAYREDLPPPRQWRSPEVAWIGFDGGLVEIGHGGDGFAFDCEGPRHQTYVAPFRLASRPVTNREYLAFVDDGGYEDSRLWLSFGIAAVRELGWRAPLYWVGGDGDWREFTLGGLRELDLDAPVSHISFYEADAFARWAGKRLAGEAEWEIAAAPLPVEGNLSAQGWLHPAAASPAGAGPSQMYGDVWEWTRSAFGPYPGFQAARGAVGEYNGKFMSGQMVLRGGSCVTPPGHVRPTYRNFFQPADRWQFSGIRLAEDA